MVAQREQALRESFERLAELERAQAASAERSRILRDMHDGVGTHLTSALRQLQASPEADLDLGLVTQTLRDSLDQLKLSIDALSLSPGDVVGLLASLRFRITPRLKAAGLSLVWDVEDLPHWPQGHVHALRQLQYILFEGLSNALQHSAAHCLTLSARAWPDRLVVSLIDDGRGWHGAGVGQGVQAMRARAQAIGAQVEFHAVPMGGLELRVILPLVSSSSASWSCAA
jgi:signal transduction histidine kinase